jgi:dephospho-CoA kinase
MYTGAMKLVLGLVGEKGSGKGTFIQTLKEVAAGKSVERIASSDILGETLDIWDIPRTRRALQDLAIVMNRHYGDVTLTHAVHNRLVKSSADILIFDGMRWQSDVDMLRSIPGSVLVYITTEAAIRYERTRLRGEKKDESSVSYEQFLDEEKVQTELDIPRIGATADIKIINGGNIGDYRNEIESVYSIFIRPRLS